MEQDTEYTLTDYISFVTAISTLLLYMTGWPAVRIVMKRQSTGEMSTFPYIAMFANCTLWVAYGWLVGNKILIGVNAAGLAHQIIFLSVFYWYSKDRNMFNRQLLYSFSFLISMYTYIFLARDRVTLINNLGMVCVSTSTITYAAPLSAMGEVITRQSTSSMNFSLSLANFLVGLEWSLYGRYLGDNFVMGPNILGTILSVAQLSLFIIYPSKPKAPLPP